MLVYIVVGSVREGRTAIKIANWVESTIPTLGLKDFQTEVVDLKMALALLAKYAKSPQV